MTPGARVAAAIEVLERIRAGEPAEKALTNWARTARYAGSKDRAALRDHVFSVLRCWRSCAAWGGGEDGRALLLGSLRLQGIDADTIFTGEGHAPAPLTEVERVSAVPDATAVRDLPDWLWERFEASLGANAEAAVEALRVRAPIMLRVNARRATRAAAQARLASEGIVTQPVEIARHALQVIDGERKITTSQCYAEGWVELQDGSSQAAMEALELPDGARVLDYCAGGGGKVLALAARVTGAFFAHDAAPQRMRDLPVRAARAGVDVGLLAQPEGEFDLVLCDAPCSGSGTWRRTPEAKWALTPERLEELTRLQLRILSEAAPLVAPAGRLVYATCSVLKEENQDVIARFARENPEWTVRDMQHWPISETGDGFFLSQLERVR
ncbi:RsmB/NOP family class I SAM-dependent RNA methyltransferase [Roseovarius mucosus]|uniref:RsmB/NOP family class I SAM-dependent RNA methyltransferase n=1 Tax=Roseovarius mucosus TaxID=215743 RepID=UPI001C5DA368|nr:RsmB/NOP family class I SAM-dependent RNA methyltransferase [Roseovarius mucosus]MBW4972061.1 RsmB/NOP family class I SAM-dependent RNA methyltransferase [Roseovarius mucosus]